MQKHELVNFPELRLESKLCQGEGKITAFGEECFCKGQILSLNISLL